jgi:hypothetical protein
MASIADSETMIIFAAFGLLALFHCLLDYSLPGKETKGRTT